MPWTGAFPKSKGPGLELITMPWTLGLERRPEPAPAPSKIFVPEQHIYIDKPGF